MPIKHHRKLLHKVRLSSPAEKVSNRMPCKVPHIIIMSIGNFNLRSFMPVKYINCNNYNKQLLLYIYSISNFRKELIQTTRQSMEHKLQVINFANKISLQKKKTDEITKRHQFYLAFSIEKGVNCFLLGMPI